MLTKYLKKSRANQLSISHTFKSDVFFNIVIWAKSTNYSHYSNTLFELCEPLSCHFIVPFLKLDQTSDELHNGEWVMSDTLNKVDNICEST